MFSETLIGSTNIQQVVDATDYANYVEACSHMILDRLQILTSGQSRGKAQLAVPEHATTEINDFVTLKSLNFFLVVHTRRKNDYQKDN